MTLMERTRLLITTPRLTLLPPVNLTRCIEEYIEAIGESLQELSRWLPWAKRIPSVSWVESYVAESDLGWSQMSNYSRLPIWIMDRETEKLLGQIVMWNFDWEIPKIEFGYWLRTSQTGQGYVTEAVNAISRYAFSQFKANRIEIRCEIDNTRAQQVPRNLNFHQDGIFQSSARAVSDYRLTDVIIFSITETTNLPPLEITWQDLAKF